jgi:hypothetical protein
MDQQDNLINQQDAADLVERLQAATTAAEVRPLVKRAMPRRLRHFVSHPLSFRARSGRHKPSLSWNAPAGTSWQLPW